MAAAIGLWSHNQAAQRVQAQAATPSAGAAQASNSSGEAGSATISANDFLTLLVTEMQNQDPTADTDPNAYINQLVQVNSLEQLISINQTVTGVLGGSTSSDSTPASAKGGSATTNAAHGNDARAGHGTQVTGNLSIPETSSAAARVAQALSGRRTTSHF